MLNWRFWHSNKSVESINTKGKFTYIKLVNGSKINKKSFYLFNTLGLSGGWTLKSNNKKTG